jgi:tRNA dimethylallyltransferase
MMQLLPPALLLMGPTASGKTALAVALAQQLHAEIISVDSALVYRGMDIGTAKPTLMERGGVPHHLIDILDPLQSFSTGEFRSQAWALMDDITRRGKLPILVGGTMLYFHALTQGLAQLPAADAAVRERLDAELARDGKAALHARLAAVDPAAAARIHVNDPQRVQRALEVFALSGRPISSFFGSEQQAALPYRVIKLVIAPLERKTLHHTIAERFKGMLAQGFLDEVQQLRQRGDLDVGLPSMRCVGYRQAWEYLDGTLDAAAFEAQAIAATRQLAKRQFTWLRKEQQAFSLISGASDVVEQAVAYCQAALCADV